jgi:hypothetical protein
MTKNRAKEERILCTGEVGTATDSQLELAFQHQAEFFALVLDWVLATALWLDDVDIGLKKHPFTERYQSLVLNAFASAERIDIEDRPGARARNDVATSGRAGEEAGEIDLEGLSDALEGRQRRYDPIGLYFRQHALRTAGPVRKRLLAHGFRQAGVPDSGTKQKRSNLHRTPAFHRSRFPMWRIAG